MNECSSSWDLVVIGGGPAGAAAAITAARHGLRTLIADRSEHPRPKVCGCCLSPMAIERLNALGVSAIAAHGEQLHTVQVDCLGMLTKWQRSGVALSRARLDSELLHMAAAAGASVMTGVVAEAQPSGIVTLRKGGMAQQLNAGLVIAADGIGGSSLRSSERLRWRTLPRSRIGFGALLAHEAIDIQAGELLMCVRAGGYIGAVAIGGGIVDVAAAAEPAVVRAAGGPAALTLQWLGRRIRDRER
ncbi:MAG: NAD(P)/FAD-dependent oxidoreductase, partial [Planctomycetota bacterium]